MANINRVCIVVTFTIYALAGRDIFQKRRQLRSFNTSSHEEMVENPFTSYKTTEIQVTSELAHLPSANLSRTSCTLDPSDRILNHQGYEQYSVTIERGPLDPTPVMIPIQQGPPNVENFQRRQNNVALEANSAAWSYTKCALLFFVSLLITWVSALAPTIVLRLTLSTRFPPLSIESTPSSIPTTCPGRTTTPRDSSYLLWDSGTQSFTSPPRGMRAWDL